MMAFLTVFAQYPTTKKIKGTQVVIMTVPQAEQIDARFNLLNDSLKRINGQITHKNHQFKVINQQRERVIDTLQMFRVNLFTATKKIDSLNNEMRRIEKLEFVERRTRVRIGVGIGATVLTWVILTIIASK